LYLAGLMAAVLAVVSTAQSTPSPTPAAPATGSPTVTNGPVTAIALQRDLIGVAKRAFPAIVTVRSFVRGESSASTKAATTAPSTGQDVGWIAAPSSERDYPGFVPLGACSGFFVGKDGDMLTNLGALQRQDGSLADLIEVELQSGERALCDVIGIEPTLHIAVLRGAVFASWVQQDFAGLSFGDSDAMEMGSIVLGIGDPVGPERFLGQGLLVAKPSRDCYQELLSATYMQATMTVPPGAFGGPLVDLDGKVVGILSELRVEGGGVSASFGSAWALPSKILEGLFESIRAAGTTRSPWLGISVMSRTELATQMGLQKFQALKKPPHGIMLENVFAPSPAHAAGLQPGDFLTHFGEVEIHVPVDFQRQLYLAGVGREATLKFFRAGEAFTKRIAIEQRPEAAKPR
jgi:serine protease Do